MKLKQTLRSLLLSLFFLMPHYAARADVEYWQAFSTIFPLTEFENSQLKFQSFTVAQLAPRFDGIGVLRFSNGPFWVLSPNFQVGAYADIIYLEAPAGHPTQEYRFNLEPTFKGLWGEHFQWINRSRVEYRLFPEKDSWRLRNKMRINLQQTDLGFTPFIDNELFISPFETGFDQNRSRLGVQWPLAQGQSLELAYQWRWRKNTQDVWDNDHILTLFFFFNPKLMEAS